MVFSVKESSVSKLHTNMMSSHPTHPFPSLLFILFTLYTSLLGIHSKMYPEFVYLDCPYTTTSSTSTFVANLGVLLSSLASNSTNQNGFYNASVGLQAPDIVYGNYLCRGDISGDDCHNCIMRAQDKLSKNCSSGQSAIVYYDLCMLRYSNESIFSRPVLSPVLYFYNPVNMTSERDKFIELVGETLNDIKGEAAKGTDKKFATKEAEPSENLVIYTLAQCTPDLSTSDCNTCLNMCTNNLDTGRYGAKVLLPSCNVRFETSRFYNIMAVPSIPPPTAAAPPSNSGNKGKSKMALAAIVVPIAVSAMLVTISYYHHKTSDLF